MQYYNILRYYTVELQLLRIHNDGVAGASGGGMSGQLYITVKTCLQSHMDTVDIIISDRLDF